MNHNPLLFRDKDKNEFIEMNKGFIYSIASKICRRNLNWQNDDELSISLIAFNSACDGYDEQKGNFLSYAKVIIKNALIDFFRKSKNIPILAFSDEEEKIDYIDNLSSLIEYDKEQENLKKAEEIALFAKELSEYNLSLNDLVEASPSHFDTRNTLLNIAFKGSREEKIIEHIRNKKSLPTKELILITGSNRKTFDRWRKYILVLILIMCSNDYPYIKSYLNIKVGGINE